LKILLLKLSALGDVIQTLPALNWLKTIYPEAELDWVVEERNADLLLGHPLLERVLLFKKSYFKNPLELSRFVKLLRKKDYTAVLDFQGLLKSGLICFLAKARYKMGFENHREGSPLFYQVKFKAYDKNLHAVKRYLELVRLSVNFLTPEIRPPEITPDILYGVPLPEKEPPFEFKRPYLLMVASARWETKIWPFANWERFLKLSQDLRGEVDFYFIGGRKDWELKEFAERMEGLYQGVFSLVGRLDLRELVWVMRRARGVVTVDTGPMHLASLLNKPILALFGPTSFVRTGPWSQRSIVLYEDISCRPCFKRQCKQKTCMQNLSPEKVLEALKSHLTSSQETPLWSCLLKLKSYKSPLSPNQ